MGARRLRGLREKGCTRASSGEALRLSVKGCTQCQADAGSGKEGSDERRRGAARRLSRRCAGRTAGHAAGRDGEAGGGAAASAKEGASP